LNKIITNKTFESMKKNFIYALMSAIAFTGAVSFSACSSSDEVIDNPDYNPETNSVKTTITLSVNPVNGDANSGANTRQPSSIVQSDGSFRGITDMVLVPSTGAVSTSTSAANKILLADFATSDYTAEKNYKLYADKDVTIGVNNFLFLGKAIGTTSDVANKFDNGYTVNNFKTVATTATVDAIRVTPQEIASTSGSWTTQTGALVTYLNSIAGAEGWSTTGNSGLRGMYDKFTRTIATAGSANAILLTLQKLYREVSTYASSEASSVVTAIQNAITASMNLKSGTAGSTAVLEWNLTGVNSAFPTDLGLPEGAAQYKYGTSSFEYITDGNNATSTPVDKFIFPNELYYLTSTPIMTTTSATPTWPTTATAWQSYDWAGNSWSTSVSGGTKNIALKYNIQYGSALLATQVKCAAATLYDNAKVMDETNPGKNKAITLNDSKKFKLTGVIVGSQPSEVGWNYLPVSGAVYTYALYDRITTPVEMGTGLSASNYTLVFDNYKSGASGTDLDVKICLEFLNDAEDFYGKDGIILKGHKFYLVGKLKVSDTSVTNPLSSLSTEQAFFPSTSLRAYIQDFTTTAQFTITAGSEDGTSDGSLEQAVSTVPDLRATSQTIGLSVDLTWRTGLTYEVNLGE
jgi:hypothetical protein